MSTNGLSNLTYFTGSDSWAAPAAAEIAAVAVPQLPHAALGAAAAHRAATASASVHYDAKAGEAQGTKLQ